MATDFKDVHIPIQPQHPGLLDPAYHYVAWPHPSQVKERDRLVTALLAAQYKAAGKHFCWEPSPSAGRPNLPSTLNLRNSQPTPRAFQKLRQKDIPAAVHEALARIHGRRVPALRMLVQHWIRAGLIEPHGLTAAQSERLRELNATNALLDPDGDLLGMGRPFIRESKGLGQRDNIKHRIWQDSRPALAMIAALKFLPPLRPPPLSVVALLEDASWVADAVWDARWLALVIERTINPPTLLVPRRVEVRGTSRMLPVRTRAWAELMLPSKRVAAAPKTAP